MFSATWNVPNKPNVTDSPIYIFNGIQPKDNVKFPPQYFGGIIQPILIFNCGPIDTKTNTCTGSPHSSKWTGAAVHDPPYDPKNPKPDIMSEQIPVAQTDTVQGTMMWDTMMKSWTVTFTNINTGKSTHIHTNNAFPPNHQYIKPVFVAYEARAFQLERNRAWGDITFSNIKLGHWLGAVQIPSNIETGYNEQKITEGKSTYDKNNYYVDTTNWPSSIRFQIPQH
jgi:hypothetical protein